MSNFTFTSDIVLDALFRAGEPQDSTSDYYTEAFVYVNTVYNQVCRGGSELDPDVVENWAWLRKASPGVLILQPPITAGTITATLGSATATLTTVPTNYAGTALSVANWFLRIGNHPDTFKVSAHTSGVATLTLDSVFTGATVSDQSYTLFLTDYNLATDVLRVVAPMRSYRNTSWDSRDDYKVYSVGLDTMEEEYPLALIQRGIPDYFAPIGETTAGTKRVRFNRCGGLDSTTVYRLEYEYLYRPTALTSPGTTEEPVLPLHWRHILADFTLAYLFGTKSDSRAGAAAQAAHAGLIGMAKENRFQTITATRNAFRLRPRHRYSRFLKTESGLIIG